MKRFIIFACLLTLTFSASAMKKRPRNQSKQIHVISAAIDIFYFKSHPGLDGATIDIYDFTTGEKVLSDVIKKRRTIIDLYFQKPGDYIILITKDDFKRKYVFHRK